MDYIFGAILGLSIAVMFCGLVEVIARLFPIKPKCCSVCAERHIR